MDISLFVHVGEINFLPEDLKNMTISSPRLESVHVSSNPSTIVDTPYLTTT